jgi:cytochrome oxidase Cu insertion factor (SCO1/SenC/PrrC family)
MPAMYKPFLILLAMLAAPALGADPVPTEAAFRKKLGIGPAVRMEYRNVECKAVNFDGFVAGMSRPGAHADVEREVDGSAVTMTVRERGRPACPSLYTPVTAMPPFDLKDLNGKRVTSAGLGGKPTLISFYFAKCVPCIREVEPLNRIAAANPQMNFLSVTADDPEETRAFVRRFGVRWRVVPDAQDFIDRMRVKNYPLLALFDADGRLLGTKVGGARDELEAANVEPQVKRWMQGLLKN